MPDTTAARRALLDLLLDRIERGALLPAEAPLIRPLVLAEQGNADRAADYDNRLTWETTCGERARLLEASYDETVRAETAEAAITQLREELEQAKAQLRSELARQEAYEDQIVGQFNQQATNLTRRAGEAEAAIARVRAELDRTDRMLGTDSDTFRTAAGARIHAQRIRGALNPPADTGSTS